MNNAPILLCRTDLYEVNTVYKETKILVNMWDGQKALIRHKDIVAVFMHRRTGDVLTLRKTGKGLWYEDGKQISEKEAELEFKRLLDDRWDVTYKQMCFRLVMGV